MVLFADRNGIPVGWAIAGANRHDSVLLEPTLLEVTERALMCDAETPHLDRGYDNNVVRAAVADFGIDDLICSRRRSPRTATTPKPVPLGMRWPIERTNSWLSNFGQLRRNTDRRNVHRLAQLSLAIVILIIAKLIDWRTAGTPSHALSAEPLIATGDHDGLVRGGWAVKEGLRDLYPCGATRRSRAAGWTD